MTKFHLAIAAITAAFVAPAVGQQPTPPTAAKTDTTTATFLMNGLHCPPCVQTVESSLRGVKGIWFIKVDWKTKAAKVKFDETILPAQRISQLIAATPHMMGSSLHYAGWLAFRAAEIKDDASGKQAEEALSRLDGVKSAKAYPAQHIVAVYFASKGALSTRDLVDSLKEKGFHAETY